MLNIIEDYYKSVGINPLLLKRKLAKLEKHSDIAAEFAYWIEHGNFKKGNCIQVAGYTAESLAQLSNYLCGEGAYMLLVELREDPKRAKQRIADGFKLK